ncbi:MAG: response regulator transcription factor, partial [Bacteroidota bacterium]
TIQRASETQPSAYVLKPFQEKDLKVALEMATFKCSQHKVKKSFADTQLFVKDNKGYMKPVQVNEILFFSADDNYCHIHTASSRYMVLHKLKDFLQEYRSQGFVQVHRSYVININQIAQLTDLHVYVGTHKIPIGKSFRQEFFQHFKIL